MLKLTLLLLPPSAPPAMLPNAVMHRKRALGCYSNHTAYLDLQPRTTAEIPYPRRAAVIEISGCRWVSSDIARTRSSHTWFKWVYYSILS